MSKLAVVAFGGNALLRSGQKGTYQEQLQNVKQTCQSLHSLIERGYNLVIGHGNGPQVGNVMLQHEAGRQLGIEAMPMDFCVAETQGSIAYLIEMGMRNVLGASRNVVTLVTPHQARRPLLHQGAGRPAGRRDRRRLPRRPQGQRLAQGSGLAQAHAYQ